MCGAFHGSGSIRFRDSDLLSTLNKTGVGDEILVLPWVGLGHNCVVVAVVSARLALFVFEVGFGYGETQLVCRIMSLSSSAHIRILSSLLG